MAKNPLKTPNKAPAPAAAPVAAPAAEKAAPAPEKKLRPGEVRVQSLFK